MDRTPDDGPTRGHSAHKAPEESVDAGTQGRETTGPETFKSVDDFVETISGERPSDDARRELDWYDDLRDGLRMLRNAADLSQSDLAGKLGVGQSEVSRIETTLGPGTRIGRIREFAKKCGAHTVLNFERYEELYRVTEEDLSSKVKQRYEVELHSLIKEGLPSRLKSEAVTLDEAVNLLDGSIGGSPDYFALRHPESSAIGGEHRFKGSYVTESEQVAKYVRLMAQTISALDRAMSANSIPERLAQRLRRQFLEALESQVRTDTKGQAYSIRGIMGTSQIPSDVHVRMKETKEGS